MKNPVIAVFCGGTSAEREVSLGSGRACAAALARFFPTRLFEIGADALPDGLDAGRHVVFSTLHGTFGEDGGMQALLDRAAVCYAGCGAEASRLTMDKAEAKAAVAKAGVRGARGVLFDAGHPPGAAELAAQLGPRLVVKPNNSGSSVGLCLIEDQPELERALGNLTPGRWLAEERISGRELSVGVLNGEAMGVVEIRPKSGVYDYTSKYTKGMTQYLAPAPLDGRQTARVKQQAEAAFAACGCRDYARVDFILAPAGDLFFLEINTLPGMKETSLLPMSARCAGLDFGALVRAMVEPAVRRFLPADFPKP